MIKALFLIFEPAAAWERVVREQRNWKFILIRHLLPMMLIVALAEGLGLVEWGKSQPSVGVIKTFTLGEATIYEVAQIFTVLITIAICTYFIKSLGDTFHAKHTFEQGFIVVAYGLSPVFLFRLLDVIPGINSLVAWCIGILFSVTILYHGVPLVMRPDPPHAFGLYLMSALLLVMVTGFERFLAMWCLSGHWKPLEILVSNLAIKLPF